MYYSVAIKDGVITFFNPQPTQAGAASGGDNGAFIGKAYSEYTRLYDYGMHEIHRIPQGYPESVIEQFNNKIYVLVVDPDVYIKIVGPFPTTAHAEGWSWYPGFSTQAKSVVGTIKSPFHMPVVDDSVS